MGITFSFYTVFLLSRNLTMYFQYLQNKEEEVPEANNENEAKEMAVASVLSAAVGGRLSELFNKRKKSMGENLHRSVHMASKKLKLDRHKYFSRLIINRRQNMSEKKYLEYNQSVSTGPAFVSPSYGGRYHNQPVSTRSTSSPLASGFGPEVTVSEGGPDSLTTCTVEFEDGGKSTVVH